MKKSALRQLEKGSAAYVVAHALWSKSRGRSPSVPYLAQYNPRKALVSAKLFLKELERRQQLIDLLPKMGTTTPNQARRMDHDTYRCHIRRIVASSSTQEELETRLEQELGLDCQVEWFMPTDQIGIEARELVKAFDGLVSGSGAMVALPYGIMEDDGFDDWPEDEYDDRRYWLEGSWLPEDDPLLNDMLDA